MNTTNFAYTQLSELIAQTASGTIVLPPLPSSDAIAAATSLYIGMTQMGKNITLASSTPVSSELYSADKISDQLISSGDTLVVSFPYVEGAIDKVYYNIANNKFNLVISPRAGYERLNPSGVQFNYSGGSVDFFIVIGAPTLNSLGKLYSENQKEFTGKPIVNIDIHPSNNSYGAINIVEKQASSISEVVLHILQNLQIEIDKEMATNLYNGIIEGSQNFANPSVNAYTFEAVANLMKMGAVKLQLTQVQSVSTTPTPLKLNQLLQQNKPVTQAPKTVQSSFVEQTKQTQAQTPSQPVKKPGFVNNAFKPFSQPQRQQSSAQQQIRQEPKQAPAPKVQRSFPHPLPKQQQGSQGPKETLAPAPIEEVENKEINDQNSPQQNPSQNQQTTPQDWLKPKIFKGGGLV